MVLLFIRVTVFLGVTLFQVLSYKNYTTHEFIDTNVCEVRQVVKREIFYRKSIIDVILSMKRAIVVLHRFYNEIKITTPGRSSRSQYLENLSNSFAMVGRICNRWPPHLSLMKITFGSTVKNPQLGLFVIFGRNKEEYEAMKDNKTKTNFWAIDTNKVWTSAMVGLLRLQETYNLSTADLASGNTPGPSSHTPMTASDCFDLGTHSLEIGRPARAVEWFSEALNRSENESNIFDMRIRENLHLAYCHNGHPKSYTDILQGIMRNNFFSSSEELYEYYIETASMKCMDIKKFYYDDISKDWTTPTILQDVHSVHWQQGLCRKENYRPSTDKRLRCRMIHYNQPYLKIGPLKMEEFRIDPPMLIFHNVISDKESRTLIRSSYNKIKHALFDYDEKAKPYQDTQCNHWLFDQEAYDHLVYRLNRRSAVITNAGLYRSEALMLANYGLAAEIRMHTDFGNYEQLLNEVYSWGDYITLMYWVSDEDGLTIYLLNEPAEGGFTIFPNLKQAVVPVKGSAIMWFNRYPNLEGISDLDHSGCPVLQGTKWILTKWFHVIQQEFPKCVPGKEKSREYYYLESNII